MIVELTALQSPPKEKSTSNNSREQGEKEEVGMIFLQYIYSHVLLMPTDYMPCAVCALPRCSTKSGYTYFPHRLSLYFLFPLV